jgi:putative phosphoesterase
MKIGILSDTHNNISITEKALELFRASNVDLIIHAGDLTSPRMLGLFKDFPCKFVLGNSDIDIESLNTECGKLGFGCIGNCCTFKADGKNFMVFHGDDVPMFRTAVASGSYDYVIKGHTHFFENYISNKTRVINPGSLYGSDEFTIAILDTETDRVERILIEED